MKKKVLLLGLFWGVRNDHITRREIAMRDKPIGSVEFMAQAWKKWLTISIHAALYIYVLLGADWGVSIESISFLIVSTNTG